MAQEGSLFGANTLNLIIENAAILYKNNPCDSTFEKVLATISEDIRYIAHSEEEYSIAIVRLWQALKTWDQSKSSFRWYASVCMTRAVQYYKHSKSQPNIPLDGFDKAADIPPEVDLDKIKRLIPTLTKMERKVVKHEMNFLSPREIAKKLKMDIKSIYNLSNQIRQKGKDIV